MRQLLVLAPEGVAADAMRLLEGCEPLTMDRWWADEADGRVAVAMTHVENHKVEGLIEGLSAHEGVRVAVQPTGALVLQPDDEAALDRSVRDVTFRSPVEIVAGSLQSVGSWGGFLAYAATSAFVSWIGLYTDTIYLLVAAMLIAPFAEPSMTAAIGTARGMPHVVGRSLARYGAALLVTVVVAAGLTLAFSLEGPTRIMSDVASLSFATAVLPLVAGVAGALNLAQSERSSLVSGAAPGMLVAAALAPPAGVVGMALVLGSWPLLTAAAFVLALQLVGIHLTASIVFRLAGIGTGERPYRGGARWVWPTGIAVSGLAVVGLVVLQALAPVTLGRSGLASRAEREVQQLFEGRDDVRLLEVEARFPQLGDERTLLVTGIVSPTAGTLDADRLSREVQAALALSLDDTVPRVTFQTVP